MGLISNALFILLPISLMVCCGLLPPEQVKAKWIHPTKSEDQIQADHMICAEKAWAVFPFREGEYEIRYTEKESGAPARVTCKSYRYETACYSWPEIPERTVERVKKKYGDANLVLRSDEYARCMEGIDSKYSCWEEGVAISMKVHGGFCGSRNKNRGTQ